jgi:hypothetical protein
MNNGITMLGFLTPNQTFRPATSSNTYFSGSTLEESNERKKKRTECWLKKGRSLSILLRF